MDILQLLDKHGIEYRKTGKNISHKWIGVCCPFFLDSGFHGGFTTTKPFRYSCWRCNNKNPIFALSKILPLPYNTIHQIVNEDIDSIIISKLQIGIKPFCFPDYCNKMTNRHKKYLEERNFDPDFLEKKYKLLGTSHLGDYCHRIITPIFINQNVISYQGRDITNRSKMRYKACPTEYEIIHHKHILYNIDNTKKENVVVVEGITGVWRLGDNSICTFGVKYTSEQALLLCKFKKVFVFFDTDDGGIGQEQSERLRSFLNTYGVKTVNITTDKNKDSGSISNEEAKEIMKNI